MRESSEAKRPAHDADAVVHRAIERDIVHVRIRFPPAFRTYLQAALGLGEHYKAPGDSIITETTGVDTSDPVLFPKENGSTTRVRNFNDLWIVKIDGHATARLVHHHVFDLALRAESD
jgi:hypothetical protein